MVSIRFFDAEDVKQLEDIMFRAMTRALRVVLNEGKVQAIQQQQPPIQPPPSPIQPKSYEKPEIKPAHPEKQKRKQRDLRKIIPTVQHRPHGWIDRSEATKIVGEDNAGQIALSHWIYDKEVPAVIVTTHAGPPHKGLPGRVHIDKEKLLERNNKRQENAQSSAVIQMHAHRKK